MTHLSYGDALCAAREREDDMDEAMREQHAALSIEQAGLLALEFTHACEAGSSAILPTPAFGGRKVSPLAEVIDNLCSGRNDYAAKFLDLLAQCMRCEDAGIRLTAFVLVSRMAKEYANTHADDAAWEQMQ